MILEPLTGESFWTHIELAVVILTPIMASLAGFFKALWNHAKDDEKAFGAVQVTLGRMDTKLDAMWDDWKKGTRA